MILCRKNKKLLKRTFHLYNNLYNNNRVYLLPYTQKEMFIEIERKFELTHSEHEKIKSQLKLESQEHIEDIFMDLPDFYLTLNKMKYRIRNGKKELKIDIANISSEEYPEKEAIQKLNSLNIKYEDITQQIYTVNTEREKYT
jgi:uncharacterized protein YjbK